MLTTSQTRTFSAAIQRLAPKKKDDVKKLLAKRADRRDKLVKAEAKKPASSDPLFLPINEALRYLRAAEVGRSLASSSITIQTKVIADRGVAPLQGAVRFPKALKETRVLCLSNDADKRQAAKEAGATEVGDVSIIEKIQDGTFDLKFDKILATPELEPMLRRVAKILGPKGLMPSSKKGTINDDLKDLVQSFLGTQPFRERNNQVALTIGRCDFTDSQIIQNIFATSTAIHDAVKNTKSKRPILLGHTTISSSHGPGIVINF